MAQSPNTQKDNFHAVFRVIESLLAVLVIWIFATVQNINTEMAEYRTTVVFIKENLVRLDKIDNTSRNNTESINNINYRLNEVEQKIK